MMSWHATEIERTCTEKEKAVQAPLVFSFYVPDSLLFKPGYFR